MDTYKQDQYQEDDLERYGVWVKAGPEEVVEAEEDDDDFAFTDLPAEAGPEEFPDTISDTSTAETPLAEEISDSDFDLPDIDDFDMDGLSLDEGEDEFAIPSASRSDTGEDDEEDLVSLDDLDIEEPQDETDPFAALGDDDDDFDLGELADSLGDEDVDESFDTTIPGSDEELEEISMDELNSDTDEGEDLPELDIDNEHDFTPEELAIEIVDETPSNKITPEEEVFLASDADLQNADESAIQDTMDTQEREAFQQIQKELSDIKTELTELKRALRSGAAFRVEVQDGAIERPAEDELQPEPFEEPGDLDEPEDGRGSGFFEEDEDETIALTGDELDNILNTAEFTEQAGQAEELDDDFVIETHPEEELEEDIDSSEDDPAVQELADMDIDEELSDIDSLSDDFDEEVESTDIEPDEIEIDLDSLEDIDTSVDDEDFDTFAEQVENDIADTASSTELDSMGRTEIEDIQEIELDDDFDDESEGFSEIEEDEEEEQYSDEEIELDLDDLDVEDIDLEETGESESLETEEMLHIEESPVDESESLETEEMLHIEESPVDESEFLETEEMLHIEESPVDESEFLQKSSSIAGLPEDLKQEIRSVLSYMDQLLEALPDDKIEEFAKSEHFDVYKRLFEELGLET